MGKANERTKVLATGNSGPYHVRSKFKCETMGAAHHEMALPLNWQTL